MVARKTAASKSKTSARKPARPAGSARKATTKKSAPKTAKKKTAAPKAAKKKTAASKSKAKKTAPKKPATKKSAPKKAASKKPAKKTAKKTAPKTASGAGKKKSATRKSAAGGSSSNAASAGPAAPAKKFIIDVERPTGMYGGFQLCDTVRPFPKKSPYSAAELKKLQMHLMKERDQLRHELAMLDEMAFGESGSVQELHGHSQHIAEHASDLQSTETSIAVRHMEERRLAQIEEAIGRLDRKHNYGLCVACGDKIGIQRLMSKPHAHLCMPCREIYERKKQRGSRFG